MAIDFEARKLGIGGSDVPAILGLSRWKTPYQIWMEKTGLEPIKQEEKEWLDWGHRLEPVIRQKYCDVTGRTVSAPESLVHPEYPFMRANIDGITDHGVVLECKNSASSQGWGEEWTDEIPKAYICQSQHYLMVTGKEEAHVAVLFFGQQFRIYRIKEDKDLQDIILAKESIFWKMVEGNVPPAPISASDAAQRWNIGNAKTVVAKPELFETLVMYRRMKDEVGKAQAQLDHYAKEIMQSMEDAETLVSLDGKVLATWRNTKNKQRRFNVRQK